MTSTGTEEWAHFGVGKRCAAGAARGGTPGAPFCKETSYSRLLDLSTVSVRKNWYPSVVEENLRSPGREPSTPGGGRVGTGGVVCRSRGPLFNAQILGIRS